MKQMRLATKVFAVLLLVPLGLLVCPSDDITPYDFDQAVLIDVPKYLPSYGEFYSFLDQETGTWKK